MTGRPSDYIGWVPSGNVSYIQEPSTGKKATGWVSAEKPTFQNLNWLFYQIDQWIQYHDGLIAALRSQFDAVVGGGGVAGATDATLAAALANSNYGAGMRVLLADSQSISSAVQMTKNYWRLSCVPGVTYTYATSGVLQVNAQGCEIRGLRMVNFPTAIQVQASGIYCRVVDCWFNACTTEIDDSAVAANKKVTAYGNVSEL